MGKRTLLYYIDDKEPIKDIEKLTCELEKIKVYEVPFKTLLNDDKYGVKYDNDPRQKLEKVIYNRKDFYLEVFIRDKQIYSAKIYGYPTKFANLVIKKIVFNDDDLDDSIEY